MEAYFDNSATTRCFEEVKDIVVKTMMEDFGNPSAMHQKGVDAEGYVKESARTLAQILKVTEKEILFTSGGTESNNLALIGGALANKRSGNHIITTAVEHAAVSQPVAFLQEQGFEITYLPVDASGRGNLEALKEALCPDTILVSVMYVNNEVGTLQPIDEAVKIVKEYNSSILFHSDAVQGFGKYHIYPKRQKIDLLSASGHKIHGPKGIGVLYIDEHVKIKPIVFGGEQQKNVRSGTENVPGIAGLAKAAEMLYSRFDEDHARLCACKRRFIEGVRELDQVTVNGLLPDAPYGEGTAAHIVSVSFAGVRSEVLLHALEDKGIYVSAGSACSAHKPQPSATLKAIGVDKSLLDSTIRFSFSVFTTEEEIDVCLRALYNIVPMLRRYSRR